MTSDADSRKPADEPTPDGETDSGQATATRPAEGEAEASAAAESGQADTTSPTDAEEPGGTSPAEGADAAGEASGDGPAEVAAKGQSGLFLLLTCGFLACMCCVGLCFAGVTVGVNRTANLKSALESVGEPADWKTRDRTIRPWSASATLVGPASTDHVTAWLEGLGHDVTDSEAAACLEAGRGCDVEATVDGFGLTIHYGPADGGAEATVHIG